MGLACALGIVHECECGLTVLVCTSDYLADEEFVTVELKDLRALT